MSDQDSFDQYDADQDDAGLDLTPVDPGRGDTRKGRSWRNILIVGTLVLVLGAVLFQALTSARVFFYNVDEAIEQRDDIGDRRFRIQGTVVDEPAAGDDGTIVFTIAHNDARATVRHIGEEPTELFELGIPVVAEGRWDGREFESSQLLVKHSESYVADNEGRDGVGDGTYEVDGSEVGLP